MSDVSKPLKTLGLGELRNRVVISCMSRRGAVNDEKVPNELMVEYFAEQADRAGLIVVEGAHISKQGTGRADMPGIYTSEQAEGWKKVTEAVHAKGCKLILQLLHQGRISHEHFTGENNVVAPSAMAAKGEIILPDDKKVELPLPRELALEEIPAVVDQFLVSAELAKKAGFDGVEIQGDAGYLIGQFLYSKTNFREDQYGGTVEKRLRFMNDVIKVVTKEFPPGQVGINLTPNANCNDMGSPDFREMTDAAITKCIAWHKLAFIRFSDGLGFGWHGVGERYTLEDFMKGIRAVQGNEHETLLLGNVGLTFEEGNKSIADGHVDLLTFDLDYIKNSIFKEQYDKSTDSWGGSYRNTWNEHPCWDMHSSASWFSRDWSSHGSWDSPSRDHCVSGSGTDGEASHPASSWWFSDGDHFSKSSFVSTFRDTGSWWKNSDSYSAHPSSDSYSQYNSDLAVTENKSGKDHYWSSDSSWWWSSWDYAAPAAPRTPVELLAPSHVRDRSPVQKRVYAEMSWQQADWETDDSVFLESWRRPVSEMKPFASSMETDEDELTQAVYDCCTNCREDNCLYEVSLHRCVLVDVKDTQKVLVLGVQGSCSIIFTSSWGSTARSIHSVCEYLINKIVTVRGVGSLQSGPTLEVFRARKQVLLRLNDNFEMYEASVSIERWQPLLFTPYENLGGFKEWDAVNVAGAVYHITGDYIKLRQHDIILTVRSPYYASRVSEGDYMEVQLGVISLKYKNVDAESLQSRVRILSGRGERTALRKFRRAFY